jgi:hypothetical protein
MEGYVVETRILAGQGGWAVGVVYAGFGAYQGVRTAFERGQCARFDVQQINALLPLDQESPAVGQEDHRRWLLQTGGNNFGPESETLAFKDLLRYSALR